MPNDTTPTFDPSTLIDPATGQPYPYGSVGYQTAIYPYLEQQLMNNMGQSEAARGDYDSGGAEAAEQLAASNLLEQMASQGAQQSESEAQLLQQEQFQQQLQAQQNQANADAAKVAAKGQTTSAALQGGLSALGTVGGLTLAHYLWPGAAAAKTAALPAPMAVSPSDIGPIGPNGVPIEADGVPIDPTSFYEDPSATAAAAAPADTVTAGAPNAGVLSMSGETGDLGSLGVGTMAGAGLSALGGGLIGGPAGLRTFGDSTGNQVLSGLGGAGGALGGAALGTALFPGLGTVIGAGLGAAGGSFLGPGLGQGLTDLGKDLNISHWF